MDNDNVNDEEIKIYHSNEDDYSHYEEASFLNRLIAIVIDGFIIAFANKVLTSLALIGMKMIPGLVGFIDIIILLISLILPTLYQVLFLTNRGQTLGKMAMKIKVVYQDSNEPLSVGTVMIREPIGKFISGLFLLIGYLVVLFDKRAWHDNMANTKVIKIK